MRSPLPALLRRTKLVLLWEQLWRALVWPAAGGTAALLGLAVLSRLPDPPEPIHWVLLVTLALLPVAGLALGLGRFRFPTQADSIARLDRDLPHAPARTLLDRLVTEDPLAQALWVRHQASAAAALTAAPPPVPRPGLAARDPCALRALIPLLTFVALVILQADDAALERALWPPAGRPVPPLPTVQAWLEPPPHAEGAAVQPLLQDGQGRVPQGGRLRLSVSGAPAEAFLDGRPLALLPGEDLLLPLSTPLQALLNVRAGGQEIWRTQIEVLRDQPPHAEIVQGPDRGDGRLRLSVRFIDDLGLRIGYLRIEDSQGNAEIISLDGVRGRTVEIPVVLDVARDARAGSVVRLVAVAKDGANQSTEAALETVLPERQWRHPLARRLAEARRLLLRHGPAAVPGIEAAAVDLRAANAPLAAVLAASAAARRAQTSGGFWEAEGLLWEAAVEIEEGPAGRALANAIRAAQAAKGLEDTRAIEAALDGLMEALAHLAQVTPSYPQIAARGGNTQSIRAEDLAAAAAEARRLAAEGRLEEAREILARLAETLQRLAESSAQGQAPDPARQAAAQAMAKEARRLLAEQIAVADRLAQVASPPIQGPDALSREDLAAEAEAAAREHLFPDDEPFHALPAPQRAQLRAQEAQHAQRLERQRAQIAAQLEAALVRHAAAEAAEADAARARAEAGSLAPQAAAQRRIAEGAAGLEAGAEALGLSPPGAAGSAARAADALENEDMEGASAAQGETVTALRRLLEQLEQAGGQGTGGSGAAPGARHFWNDGRPDLTGQGGGARHWQERIQERLKDTDATNDARRYWRRLLRLPESP